MLAELAIANAAFSVIKQTLSNGKQLIDAGDAVNNYFTAEKAIAKKAASTSGNVLEAFQAKEQLARQEEELKFMLNKQRLHGYQDFLKFKAAYTRDMRDREKAVLKERIARNKAIEENVTLAIKVVAALLIIFSILFGAAVYIKKNPSTLSGVLGNSTSFHKTIK